uniref:Putative secreted protein n=1 Tax=Anopheles marajoara TaxID=58244 RepID=A0A2M4C7N9_9DIPT
MVPLVDVIAVLLHMVDGGASGAGCSPFDCTAAFNVPSTTHSVQRLYEITKGRATSNVPSAGLLVVRQPIGQCLFILHAHLLEPRCWCLQSGKALRFLPNSVSAIVARMSRMLFN